MDRSLVDKPIGVPESASGFRACSHAVVYPLSISVSPIERWYEQQHTLEHDQNLALDRVEVERPESQRTDASLASVNARKASSSRDHAPGRQRRHARLEFPLKLSDRADAPGRALQR